VVPGAPAFGFQDCEAQKGDALHAPSIHDQSGSKLVPKKVPQNGSITWTQNKVCPKMDPNVAATANFPNTLAGTFSEKIPEKILGNPGPNPPQNRQPTQAKPPNHNQTTQDQENYTNLVQFVHKITSTSLQPSIQPHPNTVQNTHSN
jgi:hypothetical protein